MSKTGEVHAPAGIPSSIKLLIGVGGIYAAFLYYGTLQEDVFHYKAADGTKFTQAWFLQAIEALANVIIGGLGLLITGGTKNLPQDLFGLTGVSQVRCFCSSECLVLSAISGQREGFHVSCACKWRFFSCGDPGQVWKDGSCHAWITPPRRSFLHSP